MSDREQFECEWSALLACLSAEQRALLSQVMAGAEANHMATYMLVSAAFGAGAGFALACLFW